MSQKLAGKIAVITGGSSGIGLATARLFVDEGAYVFITGRRQNELDAAVKKIGRNVTGIQGDVAKLADIDKIYAAVKAQKGKVDIVFANAGIGEFAPFAQITEEPKTLIVSAAFDKNTYLSARNVQPTLLITASEVNTEQLLHYRKIVITNDGLAQISDRLAK